MSLEKLKEKRAEQGFTIVELLIVIVIIGILAAIVIVAYTGVTQQAKDSKYKSNADAIRQVAETINATEGGYPAAIAKSGNVIGFDSSSTATLPTGVTVGTAIAYNGTAPADNAATAKTLSDAEETGAYTVMACGTATSTTGIKVYYTKGSSVLSMVAGKC